MLDKDFDRLARACQVRDRVSIRLPCNLVDQILEGVVVIRRRKHRTQKHLQLTRIVFEGESEATRLGQRKRA
jgi:hypothetical protein